MPLYLDTLGLSQVSVGICARCQRKFPIGELFADGNAGPGLRVCKEDRDVLDPWRLPARRTENITLQYPRPDVPLVVTEDEDLTYALLTESGIALLTEDGLTLEIEH